MGLAGRSSCVVGSGDRGRQDRSTTCLEEVARENPY